VCVCVCVCVGGGDGEADFEQVRPLHSDRLAPRRRSSSSSSSSSSSNMYHFTLVAAAAAAAAAAALSRPCPPMGPCWGPSVLGPISFGPTFAAHYGPRFGTQHLGPSIGSIVILFPIGVICFVLVGSSARNRFASLPNVEHESDHELSIGACRLCRLSSK
jgi:hypothetical protein